MVLRSGKLWRERCWQTSTEVSVWNDLRRWAYPDVINHLGGTKRNSEELSWVVKFMGGWKFHQSSTKLPCLELGIGQSHCCRGPAQLSPWGSRCSERHREMGLVSLPLASFASACTSWKHHLRMSLPRSSWALLQFFFLNVQRISVGLEVELRTACLG